MTAALQVKELAGGYGRLTVFRDVSVALHLGQTVGLLGSNGVGKSTLLKSIVGALPHSSGSVLLDGRDVSHLPAFLRTRAGLSLVPEGRHILGTMTVRDNLLLTRAAGSDRHDREAFDQRLSEVFGLFPRLQERVDQPGGSLSGGEQQMLAIARALLTSPRVLMLDEPTQGLAPIVIQGLVETLRALKGRFALMIVEQNKTFLELLCDRILHMRGGVVTP